MRTRIGILGAGPAGLFLALLLRRAGIDSVVLESRDRAAVEGAIRAGVLEHWVTELMRELGLGERLDREGHVHDGITLQSHRRRFHLDIAGLTDGRHVTVYPQHEVLRDLIGALLARGGEIRFGISGARLHGIDGESPFITYREAGAERESRLDCDFIVGADGYHGPSRQAIPASLRQEAHRLYPFAWLGILVHARQSWPELIYASQGEGFALLSTRTPEIQRLYLQCDPAEDLTQWPEARIWDQLRARLATDDGWTLDEGEIFQKGIIPLRSFVCAPMQHGRLFLAGDAAHIVPPTGAKGLNLAVADALVLSRAFEAEARVGDSGRLQRYSETCLRRVWKAQRFSWFMTRLLHRDPAETLFDAQVREAELALIRDTRAAAVSLAENYVGLPFDAEA